MTKFLERMPRSQARLNDWIEDLEDVARLAGNDPEVIIPTSTLVHIIALLKRVRLGHRGTPRKAYIREWATLIKLRRRKQQLRASGLSGSDSDQLLIREARSQLPEKFDGKSDRIVKEWLHRQRPRRSR